VLHESIAFRLAIEAFLVRQLRSGRHAGKSNLKRRTPAPSVAPANGRGRPAVASDKCSVEGRAINHFGPVLGACEAIHSNGHGTL
jgi:hypothetical protein